MGLELKSLTAPAADGHPNPDASVSVFCFLFFCFLFSFSGARLALQSEFFVISFRPSLRSLSLLFPFRQACTSWGSSVKKSKQALSALLGQQLRTLHLSSASGAAASIPSCTSAPVHRRAQPALVAPNYFQPHFTFLRQTTRLQSIVATLHSRIHP